jgi:hypothetical protein
MLRQPVQCSISLFSEFRKTTSPQDAQEIDLVQVPQVLTDVIETFFLKKITSFPFQYIFPLPLLQIHMHVPNQIFLRL